MDDKIFKQKLHWLYSYFEERIKVRDKTPFMEEAFKPIKTTFDIVFNGRILNGNQEQMATFWPLKDSFNEGEAFLNSDIGKLYQEVLNYFAYNYKIPDPLL